MIDINIIRKDPEFVKNRLKIKNFINYNFIDEVLGCDIIRRQFKNELDKKKADLNLISRKIGGLIKNGDNEEANLLKSSIGIIKDEIKQLEFELEKVEVNQKKLMLLIPNLPSTLVPAGKTPEDNEVIKVAGNEVELYAGAVPHWDLISKYDIINFETGVKLTGRGFPVYKGKGAKLQRALIQYFLDYNTAAGYTEYSPPYMVNEASAFGTGQLPDKEGQMYFMPADNFYLIPTAEVPVTNIYRDEIVKETELPIKMTAFTPCFRREAGSFGADVRGLNRVHQFDKVEIIQLVHPDKSYEVLDEMVLHVEKLLQALNLKYRILRLCGGDMGFTSALTYDFEVWSAAQKKWLECSSVSNFETYQTNRMKIRYKDEKGKTQLLHSLNGSSLALPRILASLLENNQTEQGIVIPDVLKVYTGFDLLK